MSLFQDCLFRKYVSPSGLSNLHAHRYNAVDHSPFSKHVLQPFFDKLLRFVPLGVAPNVITLCGIGCIVFHYLIMAWYTPDFKGEAPGIVYILCGLCVWLYSILDNLDGKQARRTGSGSPLGEMMDHGLDSLASCMIVQTIASTFQLGSGSFALAFAFLCTAVPFFMALWEEYHTKLFYLGYINGPAEGVWLIGCLHIAAGILGPEIYQGELAGYPLNEALVFICIVPGAVLTMIGNVTNVFKKCKEDDYQRLGDDAHKSVEEHELDLEDDLSETAGDSRPSNREAKDSNGTRYRRLQALRLLTPLALLTFLSALYLYLNETLYTEHSRTMLWILSFGYSLLTTRLLTCYLCTEQFPIWHSIFTTGLFLGVVLGGSMFSDFTRFAYMVAFLIVMICYWLHYWVTVVNQLADYLGIRVFSIPYPPPSMMQSYV